MLIPPHFVLTATITRHLTSIEASRQVIDSVNIPPDIETSFRRQSTLRSSLFSARIEGNRLSLDDLHRPSQTQQKVEVMNILRALNWLYRTPGKDVTLHQLLTLHHLTMNGLTESPGRLRREASAIFNSAGIAVYMPPPPARVQPLLNQMFKYLKGLKTPFIPVKAVLAHFSFEKIHPFLDGNGRVGRLLLRKVLIQGGYGMKGLVSLEEYLDDHRPTYYGTLEATDKDVTDFVEFMLEALAISAQKAQALVTRKQGFDVTDYLLPRRAEILHLVRDQHLVNFDMIRRRFLAVNERTLRYDLKKLQDNRLIRKRGTTKGVYYEPAPSG